MQVAIGVRDDPPQLPGLSHLVEHLWASDDSESGALIDSYRIANAYTSHEHIRYQVIANQMSLARHQAALTHRWNQIADASDSTIRHELTRIDAESRSRSVVDRLRDRMRERAFAGHPLGRSVLSVPDRKITLKVWRSGIESLLANATLQRFHSQSIDRSSLDAVPPGRVPPRITYPQFERIDEEDRTFCWFALPTIGRRHTAFNSLRAANHALFATPQSDGARALRQRGPEIYRIRSWLEAHSDASLWWLAFDFPRTASADPLHALWDCLSTVPMQRSSRWLTSADAQHDLRRRSPEGRIALAMHEAARSPTTDGWPDLAVCVRHLLHFVDAFARLSVASAQLAVTTQRPIAPQRPFNTNSNPATQPRPVLPPSIGRSISSSTSASSPTSAPASGSFLKKRRVISSSKSG